MDQENISFVKGNHDNAVVAAFYDRPTPVGHEHVRKHHKWIAERMEEEFIRFLDSLPITIKTEEHLFTHYHLDEMDNFIPIDQDPSGEKLDQFYKKKSDSNYRLVCFGHHHAVHNFITPKAVYFNPGALGCYHKPIARYGIIKLDNHLIIPQIVEVTYENLAFLRSYRELGVPESDFILKVFHGGQ